MKARNIDSFKNIAGISVSINFWRKPSYQMVNAIQPFKVTTLQLKKYQSPIKFGP